MKPKKYLGQNFLTRDHFPRVMTDAARVGEKDVVVEIGPGKGILTRVLLEKAKKVIAIEKDRDLLQLLQSEFKKEIKNKKLEIISGDVRDFSPKGNYKLVANIPYYITGEIIRHFLEAKTQPVSMMLMVQKEVAERIIARDKKESILSISVKAYGVPKIISKVPAGNFSPKPKVDSAILHIENISRDFFKTISEKKFFEIIRAGFAHKRKVLIKNLESIGVSRENLKKIFEEKNISLAARAEDITLREWQEISENIS